MPPRTVLIVDDDPDILEVLDMRLATMGFTVTTTTDPEAALEMIGERRFDLALFDLRMEPLDGIELTRAAHERQSRLPVLIMTAHGTIENAVDAIKDGALDFITKPFVPEELRGKIGRAIAERRWARDRELLCQVGESLASSAAIDRVLRIVAEGTLEATETERTLVALREEGRVVVKATAGTAPGPTDRLLAAAEAAMARRQPTADASGDGRLVLAAPLIVDGVADGALVVESPGYVVATEEDVDLLRLFAAQAALALKNTRDLSRLRGGALAALGRVATQVAHELNNPLGGLTLYTHVLEERFRRAADADGVEIARKIGRAVQHLAELVTDITAYGRQPDLRREKVSGAALIGDCLALMQERFADKKIAIERRLDDDTGTLLVDVREMRKVLGNLFMNALEAMPDGGTLTVRSRRSEALCVEIEVEDTGCGMDAETRSRMFDLFYTTKPNGTGLGMAIAGSIVDRHGGRLQIESAPGRGTRVRISLPTG
jgi:signal transduction histidine kinase/FixJ family two-component response regulator